MSLLDLPQDILSIILSYLHPKDYLAFCQISKAVYLGYRQDSLYWRTATSNTFRLPISPLLDADGQRWYWLYKRLKTQTQLYTWGQGVKGNLGFGRALPIPRRPHPRVGHARPFPPNRIPSRPTFPKASSNWPTETHVPDEVGVIADLQCGGWSTTILASDGKLYTTGSIDSLNGVPVGQTVEQFTRLEWLTQSTSAIRQFSAGRRHILALTDDGEILSWDRVNAKGLKVFSRTGINFGGKPTRIAAGWGHGSAYIPETGIVFWEPIRNNHTDEMLDEVHVKEKVVPGTARQHTEKGYTEVIKHIVLSEFLLWITNDSKIYACSLQVENDEQMEPTRSVFEVPGYSASDRELKDIQGQFQRFGVFTATGEVLAGNVDYLRRCAEAVENQPDPLEAADWSALTTLLSSRPKDVPALQHTQVIALAYGDYHYHALHANGKITSYGTDSQCCGSLGFPSPETGGRFRGLRRARPGLGRIDAHLLPIASLRGRQVWFEPERKDWLQWLEDQVQKAHPDSDGRSAKEILDNDTSKQSAFSEWIEQEGKHWGEGPANASTSSASGKSMQEGDSGDYANLGAYFPITIAAAGWHSGALVLFDEDRAHEIRNKWVIPKEHDEEDQHPMPGAFQNLDSEEEYVWQREGFPKVSLWDGFEMPGDGVPRPWRDGLPTMQELGIL
ncbi:regulator of chromosome condensation 1/beta-lactamase-inhibitor protein II [Exophiala viscosa]|uniref:regulator of chromosome condensation 1/beta-lactamase-inhibitor protein II n=1 Tax=Exophiala viscosa TaxID=2486360 RepID=UPI00219C18C1|nr:regulator of chromosome condensation 1/beta-lactamase-inhibitor protein II [Exophiala viscosa]